VTGLLADSLEECFEHVGTLIEDEQLRYTIGDNALHDVMWRFGPEGRDRRFAIVLDYLFSTGQKAAEAYRAHMEELRKPAFVPPLTPEYDIVFQSERRDVSPIAVVIPLYNYSQFIEEALESVKDQTLGPIDLVVVDDCSTDNSLSVALHWIEDNLSRFNYVALLRTKMNSTLGPARNAGFAFASARYIMVLDADNILLPACLERCLAALEASSAAAAFPILKQFGGSENLLSDQPWQPARLACMNYIDAIALIRKCAWAACGGYGRFHSREDYELWMKFIEKGFWATHVPEVLALYRVHTESMLHTYSRERMRNDRLWERLAESHSWIAVPPWSQWGEGQIS
jgi:GT2 family glycosyltransferase